MPYFFAFVVFFERVGLTAFYGCGGVASIRRTTASVAGSSFGGDLGMAIMPAFHEWKNEGATIARLLTGYGELEFTLAAAVGYALKDLRKGLRIIFRTRGETPRINLADALAADLMASLGAADKYADALGAIRACLKIRNRFSHCHWASNLYGLFYVSLGEVAAGAIGFDLDWRQAKIEDLREMEKYFEYAHDCLWHVNNIAMTAYYGRKPIPDVAMPAKRQPPSEPSPPGPHILATLPKDF